MVGMKSNSLHIESLIVGREGAPLCAPITMTLNAGDILVVHGSNGSGKSTLLKTLAGLLPAHDGSISANPPDNPLPPPLYLGHKRGLTPSMSVYDNVAFWTTMAGTPELVAAAMRYFDLSDAAATTVGELSAGWQQRVALTRLITIPSFLWLLDEPTANLDTDGISLLQSLLQSRAEQGGIVIIASHLHMQGHGIKTLHLEHVQLQGEVVAS